MERQKIHLNALYRGLEDLFGEKVKPQDVNGRAVYAELNENGTEYCLVKMDTKSLTNLLNLAKSEYLKFKEKHPDNNLELFFEIETEQADYWQSHFTKWQYDAKQKEWYYTLDRWKLAVTVFWGTLRLYTPELNPEIENYKAYFRHNITFNQVSTVIDAAISQVKPIWLNVEPNKYYHDFIQHVDFISLQNEVKVSQGIDVVMQICWSLETLQKDIEKAFELYKEKLPSQDLGQINAQQIAIMLPLQKVQKMANTYTMISEPYLAIGQLTDKFRSTGKPLTAANFRPVFEVWIGAILTTLLREYLQVDKMLKEIATKLPTKNTITSDAPPPAETEIQPFESYFKDISSYKMIMELLVTNGYCAPITYIWQEAKKGNKSLLVGILKHLHKKGYYKNNDALTNIQVMHICKESFGVTIGIDTIKRTNSDSFDRSEMDFIPVAH